MKSQKLKAIKSVLAKLDYYKLTIQDLIDFAKSQEPEPAKPQKKSNKK